MSLSSSSDLEAIRLVCIADKESLRWKSFEKGVAEFEATSGKAVEIEVINWLDLISVDGNLNRVEYFAPSSFDDQPALVRIESPARDFEITRALLAAGARETGDPDDQKWSEVKFDLGKLVEPRLVFLGLQRVLKGLAKSASEVEGLKLLADPTDVVSMFDKNETSQRMMEAGVATPEFVDIEKLSWPKNATGRREVNQSTVTLMRELKELAFQSFYAKLAYGSSSSGILYAEVVPSGSQVVGLSTMAMIDEEFYNTKALKELDVVDVGDRLAYLFRQGITIQRAINKSTINGDNFDVRTIVINGKVEFTIFRVSRHPITNLHLGGYRGDWDRCRAAIPDRVWLDAMDDCVRAAELYHSHIVGVDLAFDRDYFGHRIIELNPFGDFFPGWMNKNGQSIYHVELESMFEMARQI